jgi:hypothetical protein
MTKSVFGSFIVQFDIGSERGKALNKDVPTFDGKEVVVLQAECYPYEKTIRMLCELIYKE